MKSSPRHTGLKIASAAGLLSLAIVGAAPAAGATSATASRYISGTLVIETNDYEPGFWADDEHCKTTIRLSRLVTDARAVSYRPSAKCGGEIRTEVFATHKIAYGGNILTTGRVDFYEGASSNTNELSHSVAYQFYLWAGESTTRSIKVWNLREGERRDWALVTYHVTNA
ncbi:hypothetical protein [Sphaerisporangium corydalis]|uniref:Secreted protein n=1 Tax=Sphaerisporangium corydalis TaxID=1441875 RepID=A0ABV9EB55_9ACTN|nr:hypothetical protein [Sphaerisporangium corydalis]